MGDVVKEGDQVIVKKDDNLRVFTVRAERNVFMEKVKFTFRGAMGHPYGSMFEVKDFELVKIQRESLDLEKDTEITADNRDLKDTSENQTLSKDDIEEMKGEGVGGEKIVEKIVAHSNTFENKTEFSKAKYLKKKKKKYMKLFTILKPSTRLLCEMYYNKGKSRILGLRMDTVAQILAYANVRSGCNLILQENCAGFLLGAILKRLGDVGTILEFYNGSAPARPEAPVFSKDYYRDHVFSVPLDRVSSLVDRLEGKCEVTDKKNNADKETSNGDTKTESGKEMGKKSDGAPKEDANTEADVKKVIPSDPGESQGEKMETECSAEKNSTNTDEAATNSKRKEHFKADYEKRNAFKQERILEASNYAAKGNFDGLIIASKFHPTPILLNLMKFVAPSRPIVVYSPLQEPLIDCYRKLREQGNVMNLTLSETWLREYQVLPKRTHPQNNMSGTGGFLLTGIKVMNEDATKPS